jgi:hypothetical protein
MVVGGHSITDAEPKFGLAVVGTVELDLLMTNAAGRAGDILLLSAIPLLIAPGLSGPRVCCHGK